MHLSYPGFLDRKLTKARAMRAAVDATVFEFDSWLKESKLPFFPDYTDHGIDHITEVLTTAGEIMPPATQKILSPEDAAVLILAVLLHDAALHLSPAGFWELIRGSFASHRIEGLDTASWPELWQEFFFDAQRWDDHKLIQVFGRSTSGTPLAFTSDPFRRYGDLKESDRKLIGEFIRIYHPRMAHEFAVFGVPGPDQSPIKPNQLFGKEKIDIAGLIARSHGMPVRDCLDYLSDRYHRREYQQIHAIFLMTVLRVSDYLQIQPNRTSPIVPRYKNIASPLSQKEHKTHQAVKNITRTHDDPESIEIQADPEDAETFIRLQEWIKGIQEELDASWSVLGEVYGRDKRLSRLGLSIRRVRSNLETASFRQRAPFFPSKVNFEVANAEMLNLLVRPLYGDRPEIGIRELVQNAVDAVRELQEWRKHHPEDVAPSLEQEGDVEIWLKGNKIDEPDTLIVSDKGIGMTPEVARDYFLKIGASLRNSYAWKREFERHERPGRPRSRVLRSGRFGIGVLASFLLGNEIEISTRHISAKSGITFRTRLDKELIELRYDERLSVGTTITVPLNDIFLRDDEWDWYCFDNPKVLRFKGPDKTPLTQKLSLPETTEQLPTGWYEAQTQEFDAVYVGAVESKGGHSPLVCNGIKIMDRYRSDWHNFGRGELSLASPPTVVLDPDGKLPLDLKRVELVQDPSFVNEVERIACESILAGMLLNTPTTPPVASILDYLRGRFNQSWMEMVTFHPWLITRMGVSVTDAWNFLQLKADSVLVNFAEEIEIHHSSPCMIEGTFVYGEDNDLGSLLSTGILEPLELRGSRFLVTEKYGKHLLGLSRQGDLLDHGDLRLEWTNGTWSFLAHGKCLKTCIDKEMLPRPGRRSSIWPVAVEWFPARQKHRSIKPDGLSKYWKEVIRHPVIPFDMDERRNKLAHAYEVLSPYFAEHSSLSRQGMYQSED